MIHKADTIVIIGNGFDLDLGLKTGYGDFLSSDFFKRASSQGLNQLTLFKHLSKSKEHRNWIDLENELQVFARILEDKFQSNEGIFENQARVFEDDFETLREELTNFLINQEQKLDLRNVGKFSKAYSFLQSIANTTSSFLILDFNFTSTTCRLLEEFGMNSSQISERHLKIHGELERKNIVIGIEDFYESPFVEKYHFLFKSRFSQGLEVSKLMLSAKKVFVFGHSLGITDSTYFSNFFEEIFYWEPMNKDHMKIQFEIFDCNLKSMSRVNSQILRMTNGRASDFRQKVMYNQSLNCKD